MIEWVDSSHYSDAGWRSLGTIKEIEEPMKCRSVGWLAYKTKTATTLICNIAGEAPGDDLRVRGDMTIPNKAITRTKVLRA